MQIYQITEERFKKYGRVITDARPTEILQLMNETPCPEEVIYVPSATQLEQCEDASWIQNSLFGGLPVQIGYCNGHNSKLNALEYHRSSEVNIMATDAIFMLGLQQDIEEDGTYDASKVEIFFAPKNTMVEMYATTLHYAPCHADAGGFRVVVVLPRGTNLDLERKQKSIGEDEMLFAINKWLIGHIEGGLPAEAYIGIKGENIALDL